jgi:hemoglobin
MKPLVPVDSPFELVGGRDATIRLAERFYDHMDATEPALAKLHRTDADGRVSRESRDRFALFLVGWLGGPQDYVAQHGHPRLRMRHAHVALDSAMRDAWLRCMRLALAEAEMPDDVRAFLDGRFAEVADFLRNTPG